MKKLDLDKYKGHTLGDWAVHRRSPFGVTGPDGRTICSTGGYSDNRIDCEIVHDENLANARLIAAAPELLARVIYLEKKLEGLK